MDFFITDGTDGTVARRLNGDDDLLGGFVGPLVNSFSSLTLIWKREPRPKKLSSSEVSARMWTKR
jgi:hypothetical protein